jgi:hypothetical protein
VVGIEGMKRALPYQTNPVKLPCPAHPTATKTILPILTLHKIPSQKTINFFSLLSLNSEEGKKNKRCPDTFKTAYN